MKKTQLILKKRKGNYINFDVVMRLLNCFNKIKSLKSISFIIE